MLFPAGRQISRGGGSMAQRSVPDTYMKLKRRHPGLFEVAEALGQAARREGPLSEKDVQLIQLAAAAAIRSEGAVHSHTRRALDAGATAEEVRHALVSLVSTIGFPSVVAAVSWADDVLEGG
jgi:AhpD family alkylhydroperoxidase